MSPFLKEINQKVDEYLSANFKSKEDSKSIWSGTYHLSKISNIPESYILAIRRGKVRDFKIYNFYKLLEAISNRQEATKFLSREKSLEEIIKSLQLPDAILAHLSKKMSHIFFESSDLLF